MKKSGFCLLFFCLSLFQGGVGHSAELPSKPSAAAEKAWQDADPVRKQVNELRRTDPKAATQRLLQALNQVADPSVAADFYGILASVYTSDLKQPDEALTLLNHAIPLFKKPENKLPSHLWMGMIGAKAKALLVQQKAAESEALLKENLPQLLECGSYTMGTSQYVVSNAWRTYLEALKAQGPEREKEGPELLARFLSTGPLYAKLDRGEPAGWLLGELISGLQKQGKHDEALRWLKLQYQLCPFSKEEIERVTQAMAKSWAAKDEFAAIRLFQKAQTDATAVNPLTKVPEATLTPAAREFLAKYAVELEGQGMVQFSPRLVYQILSLRILRGTPEDLREAMKMAQKTLRERPDLPDGSLQVCRVFKAADLNLIRANAFLSYLEGEGKTWCRNFWERKIKQRQSHLPVGDQ